jgi:hypothetical protein
LRALTPAPHVDWSQAQITEPGTTLRVPVVGAGPEWCTEFKGEADLPRHTTFQDPWGQIGLIGVVIFVPAITPGSDKLLRQTLDALVLAAQRRAAAARPPEDPADMLSLMRSLSGSTLPG